jgi:hypothetical protein
MRRKFGQPTFPTLYFKDGVLSIPGYTFEKASHVCVLLFLKGVTKFSGIIVAGYGQYD